MPVQQPLPGQGVVHGRVNFGQAPSTNVDSSLHRASFQQAGSMHSSGARQFQTQPFQIPGPGLLNTNQLNQRPMPQTQPIQHPQPPRYQGQPPMGQPPMGQPQQLSHPQNRQQTILMRPGQPGQSYPPHQPNMRP